ncbi:MAG: hypothetical protein JXQ93_04430 [Flavobacteriaceae bacterium]
MRKITYVLASLFLLLAVLDVNAQDNKECVIKYNLFSGDYKSKKFDDAFPNLMYMMDNCPKLSVNIYKQGDVIAKSRYKKATNKDEALKLINRIYNQRLQYFADKDPAKVHSDYATFMVKNKLGSDQEIFSILEKAYKIDPTRLGVRNMYRYFKGVTDRNKDTNPQVVFDTYDDVLESVGEKLADYAKKIKKYNDRVESGEELGKREARLLKAYSKNSEALGQVESGLDNIIVTLSTCDRLIPLYNRDFEANKTNAKWLKRAVSRMYNKECTEDPLFEKLSKAYAETSPSADAYYFVARVLEKNGDAKGAAEMSLKAFELETDPFKKANFKLKFAQAAKKKGQKSKARQLAREALRFNPNLGKAYLFIASLYAGSVNDCGKNVFEKRMVYVAALNKAKRASAVDPSIASVARKYIRNYKGNIPTKSEVFTQGVEVGSNHTIKCWIGETVKVPAGR